MKPHNIILNFFSGLVQARGQYLNSKVARIRLKGKSTETFGGFPRKAEKF